MRKKQQKQMPLIEPASGHPKKGNWKSSAKSLIEHLPFVTMFFKISTKERFENKMPGHKE